MIDIIDKINTLLSEVTINDQKYNLIGLDYVMGIKVNDGVVGLVMNINAQNQKISGDLYKVVHNLVSSVAGISKVNIALTGVHAEKPSKQKIVLSGIKKVIAVVSGKGGVGKSTTAINLALALAQMNHKVGLADADVYGPSIPTMLGIKKKPESKDQKIIPIEKFGIKSMSLGFLVPEDSAVIWRGPMAVKALHQILYGTHWGQLDYLIIDMPPGTGDIHLSLAEHYQLDGVLIVSTPQTVALADAVRAIHMYQKVQIPIIGCVENMSYFLDPVTGNKNHIFGENGLKYLAQKMNLPLLAQIMMDIRIRQSSDLGQSVMYNEEIAKIYHDLADEVVAICNLKV